MRRLLLPSLVAFAAIACSSAAVCEAPQPTEGCTPAYEPTYTNVFATTLGPSCAKSGASCHAEGAQGGLSFLDASDAYESLFTRNAVVASGVTCSPLVARLESTDGKLRMPPGRALPEGEICAIRRWIAAGAKR